MEIRVYLKELSHYVLNFKLIAAKNIIAIIRPLLAWK